MARVTGLRSSVQNWRDAIVAFQIPYSHAIGQYSAVSMLVLYNMLEDSKVLWWTNMLDKFCQRHIYTIVKASAWMTYNDVEQGNHLDNISGVLKIHLISEVVVCGSLCHPHQRVGSLISYCLTVFCSVRSNLLCHVWCQAWVLQQRLCAFLRPLDFGRFVQWSLNRDCKWLQLWLLTTLWPCR